MKQNIRKSITRATVVNTKSFNQQTNRIPYIDLSSARHQLEIARHTRGVVRRIRGGATGANALALEFDRGLRLQLRRDGHLTDDADVRVEGDHGLAVEAGAHLAGVRRDEFALRHWQRWVIE